MKILCDDKFIFEITDSDYFLLEHNLLEVDAEIARRLEYIIKHKADECFKELKNEWDAKFANDPSIKSVPTRRDDYIAFVKSQPDYKNRKQREAQ